MDEWPMVVVVEGEPKVLVGDREVHVPKGHRNVLARMAKAQRGLVVPWRDGWTGIEAPPDRPFHAKDAQEALRHYINELKTLLGRAYIEVVRREGFRVVGPISLRRAAEPRAKVVTAASADLTDQFLRVGETTIPWLHVDGDLVGGYERQHIRFSVAEEYWYIPPAADSVLKDVEAAALADDRMRSPRQATNGHGYKLVDYRTYRDSGDAARLDLFFQPTRYFSMLATDYSLDVELPDGTTLRELYCSGPVGELRPSPYLANLFGVGLTVVTADGYAIFAHRATTAVSPGAFFGSVAEGAQHGRDAGDPFITAFEGAREELVTIAPDRIQLLAFGVDHTVAQWSLRGVAHVPETREAIAALRATGAVRDSQFETKTLHFVRWEPEAVADFMCAPERRWSPAAVAGTYYALQRDFPEEPERLVSAFSGRSVAIYQPQPYQFPARPSSPHFSSRDDSMVVRTPRVVRVNRSVDPSDELAAERWDATTPLAIAPRIEGWEPGQLTAEATQRDFRMPDKRLRHAYLGYLESLLAAEPRFWDGQKFCPTTVPASSTDAPKLHLALRRCRYSEALFASEVLPTDETAGSLIAAATGSDRRINFACSLGLHLLLLTSDDHVLLTQQSQAKHYYPGHWSASIEEQITSDDIGDRAEPFIARATHRALREELGFRHAEDLIAEGGIRVTSIVLQEEALFVAICGYVRLRMTAADLRSRWREFRTGREDREVDECLVASLLELASELQRPTRLWHPTTRHRIAFTLRSRFGPSALTAAVRSNEN